MSPQTAHAPKKWSIILAYYNETDFLEKTLLSLKNQTEKDFTLYLIDNASTDQSPALARRFAGLHPEMDIVFLEEKRPGQVFAQQTGLSHVSSPFVAVCDADVLYAPNYLEMAEHYYKKYGSKVVGVFAAKFEAPEKSLKSRIALALWSFNIALYPLRKNCHSGGYAHTYRTEALKKAGGFWTKKWPYLFYDHEMAHRVQKFGNLHHTTKMRCFPSDRRPAGDHPGKRTQLEHMLFGWTPGCLKDWYFYKFLGPRFAKRNAAIEKLRVQTWEKP